MFADNRSPYGQQTQVGDHTASVEHDLFSQFVNDNGSPSLLDPCLNSQHRIHSHQQLQQHNVNSLYTSPQFASQFDHQQPQHQSSHYSLQQPVLQQPQPILPSTFLPAYVATNAVAPVHPLNDRSLSPYAETLAREYVYQASGSGQQYRASPNPYVRPASAGANHSTVASAPMISSSTQPSHMPSYTVFSSFSSQPASAPPLQQHFQQDPYADTQSFLSPTLNCQMSPGVRPQPSMSPITNQAATLSPSISIHSPRHATALTSPLGYGISGQPQSTSQHSDCSQYDNEVTIIQEDMQHSAQRVMLGLNVFAHNGTSLEAGQFMPYPSQLLPAQPVSGQLYIVDSASSTIPSQRCVLQDDSSPEGSDGGDHQVISSRVQSPVSPRLKANNGAYTNLSKAFVQYVPAGSPAANRNRKNLAIQTDADGKVSKKLVAIKMDNTRSRPVLSPPSSHAATMSNVQSRKRSAPEQSVSPYHSPRLESPSPPTRQYDTYQKPGNMPSFALSVEQMHGSDTGIARGTSSIDNDRLYAELRLLAPRMQVGNSASSSSGLLSPPLPSATSMSSGYSNSSQQGFTGSPGFERCDPFEQTLVGLTLDHQPDPFLQHAQMVNPIPTQHSYIMSSPTKLPNLTSPPSRGTSSWSDLSQPFGSQQTSNVNIFNHEVQLEQPVIFDSSPAKGTIFAPVSGHHHTRTLSSPQRLRTMQSAPDLGDLYENEAPVIIRSPRKASAKRRRDIESSSPEVNGFDSPPEQETSYDDDADEDYGQRKPSKRRASLSNNVLKPRGPIQSFPVMGGTRLKPGPKPKNSLPDLQAARQTSFYIEKKLPPVPAIPAAFANAGIGNTLAVLPFAADSPPELRLSDDGPLTKDTLANYYSVQPDGLASKKGKPQKMYTCLVDGCGKEFPRKSAVESHIQTHMEDKPFACKHPDCYASFVRAHDLTRHARIHSGSKPFTCQCGKGFARGDALSRHRQRGICEGSSVPRRV